MALESELVLKEEIREILALTPPESREERLQKSGEMAQIYARFRQRLEEASGPAVAHLVLQEHRLARAEFERRLDKGETFPLGVLLEVARPLSTSTVSGKGDSRLYKRIADGIARYTPIAQQEEVVTVFGEYAGSQLDLNTNLLDVVLSYRDDIGEVLNTVVLMTPRRDEISMRHFMYGIESRKARATIIRDARNRTSIR